VARKNERKKLLARILALHAMLGSDNAGEREAARSELVELLAKHKLTWNDLSSLIAEAKAAELQASQNPFQDERTPTSLDPNVNALYLVHGILQCYIDAGPDELLAIALWILHCHVHHQFTVTPRLALTSPVKGCGKTTVLSLIEHLVPRPHRTDGISPAAVYRLIDREHRVLLVDEVDNAGLATNSLLRAVFNSGHRKGGSITRVIKDGVRAFQTFTPMAIAAIGALPFPLSHRSIMIHMKRADGSRPLKRFDENDPLTKETLNIVYGQVWNWAGVKLDLDPAMPAVLRNREADNWRPLIAIADSFGADWGERARAAASAFAQGHGDEDIGVVLLAAIRDVFDARHVDRITSADLVAALVEQDDAPWSEWRGINGDQNPRRLSQGELAKALAPFGIKSRSIRLHGKGSTAKGYYRHQFEDAWASYCSEGGTTAQASNIKQLDVA
jgi:hypothetical protein